MEDFIPMGSKEEAERIKRKGLTLEQESVKKQKTLEEVPEEAMSPEEVPEEKVKEMMHLVPIEEVYIEALQVKHPIIDWKVYTEGQRSYWKITRLGGSSASYQPPASDKEMELWVELSRLYEPDNEDQLWTHTYNCMHAPVEWKLYDTCGVHHITSKDKEIFMLVEKDYPFRKGLALVMISYKLQLVPVEDVYVQALQVKHPIIDWKVHTGGQMSYWQIIRLGGSSACYQFFVDLLKPAINDKEIELWVELKRMYEPDPDDQLWTLTQNFMHAPVEWKLYDLSGVHHLTAKDKEIFMLVEKDYPLRKGLALVMINYKLQVEKYSQMAEDLIRKIYYITNTPRQ
nr:hypothetical protein [Tanacetum cinerariifolium]